MVTIKPGIGFGKRLRTKRDVAELCRIMLQVGGVQIRGEEG